MTSVVEGPDWTGLPDGTVVPVFDANGVLQKLTYVVADLIVEGFEEGEQAEAES